MSKRKRDLFQDKEHLVRMAGIFAAGIALFLGLQFVLVPDTFGLYGHYRASAIGEETRKPRVYAGRAACGTCHGAQAGALKDGKHATLGCEACHGPLMKHAVDPRGSKAARPAAATLCPVCHERNVARPQWHKQVDSREHSGGESCNTCHQPHAPQM